MRNIHLYLFSWVLYGKKLRVKFHFIIAQFCIVIILKTEKKHTADILYVIVKFQIFYFLSCKGVVTRERENEGLCSLVKKFSLSLLILYFHNVFKGRVMQIKKALINDRLRVSNVFWKFWIPTFYNFAVIYPWNLLFSLKIAYFLTVSIAFSVYKQNFTDQ